LFGALISPTDPIAVLSILKKAGISEETETQIAGESLFNDGLGVVLFLTMLNIASKGLAQVTATDVLLLIVKEVIGGLGLGLLLGYLGYLMLKRIDHYQTEVLITLALVMCGTTIAPLFHFSGPLAMVIAGLLIGNKGSKDAMSDQTSDYVHKFWEMIDEIMNAIFFVLIGLELLLIPFSPSFLIIGGITIVVLLLARFLSLIIPSFFFRFKNNLAKSTLLIMTWGGLRGGIPVALALSLTGPLQRNLIVSITYLVVLFSILVRGLTLGRVVKKLS
jgi:monovalent cation:H+ antiporter, CPA1 family